MVRNRRQLEAPTPTDPSLGQKSARDAPVAVAVASQSLEEELAAMEALYTHETKQQTLATNPNAKPAASPTPSPAHTGRPASPKSVMPKVFTVFTGDSEREYSKLPFKAETRLGEVAALLSKKLRREVASRVPLTPTPKAQPSSVSLAVSLGFLERFVEYL